MLKLVSQDLVIRLDEKRHVLQFLVPKGPSKSGELRVFYEMTEEELSEAGKLEGQLGIALLSFLSATYSSTDFRLGRYRNAAKSIPKKWEAERSREIKSKAVKGNAAEKYKLGMQKVAQGLRAKSRAIMNEAELLLREAATLGNGEAENYLADLWPALKDRSDRSFK